jgi:hypothetical protein
MPHGQGTVHPAFGTLPVRLSVALSVLVWLTAFTIAGYLEFEPLLRGNPEAASTGADDPPPQPTPPAPQSLPPRS